MRNHIINSKSRNRSGTRLVGVFAMLLFVAMVAAINFSVFVESSSAQVAECTPGGTVSGTVFYDYNNNGVQDANEPGIPGVTVSGYLSSSSGTASAGTACQTVSTAGSEGTYSFDPAAFPVRMEFTLPASLETYLKPGPVDINGDGSTVQFVTGATAGVDVGFHDPADYCQANFDFSTTCFAYGVTDNITTPQDAVVSLDFNTPGVVITATGFGDHARVPAAPHAIEAQTADVGSVLGLAYSGLHNDIYASAWVKRHVDLGPAGAGAIYQIDPTTNATTLYFDINSLPGSPAGTVTNRPDTPAAFDPGKHLFFDVDAFGKVGSAGIGDIDLSPDDKTLFVVNMADKQLYILPAGSPTVPVPASSVSSVAIPHTCTVAADARPMGLGYNNGKMYVGSVCTAESVVDNLPLSNPSVTNNITFTNSAEFDTIFQPVFYAEVFEFDIASGAFNTTPVLRVDLTYDRGCVFRTGLSTPYDISLCANAAGNTTLNWRPWQSDWTQVFDPLLNSGETSNAGAGNPVEYPQPLLSDIEFDGEDMILGLRDMNGDRTGHGVGVPSTSIPAPGFTITQTFRGAGFGDTLRACSDGSVFTLENNGTCGSITTVGQNTNTGPGGGEYYWNDNTPGGPNSTAANWWANSNEAGHAESSLGMLMQVAGQDQLVVPAVDITEFYDSGFIYYGNANGTSEKRVKLYDAVVDFNTGLDSTPTGEGQYAGKGNGVGDLEAICEAAPIQVGNLIWIDANSNGIQDPGEAGAAGVTVDLYSDSNLTAPIASATTDVNGRYYFSSGPGTDTGSSIYNVAGLLPESGYSIVVVQNQVATPIENLFPTLANASGSVNGDIRDSDGISTTLNATLVMEAQFTTGIIGENDHTIDIGFSPVEVQEQFRDWGDLPDTFTTSSNVNGPNHILVDGLRMGECSDGETNGTPTAQAIGDDQNLGTATGGGDGTCLPLGDDEDGILFRTFTPNNASLAICTRVDVFVTAWVPSSVGADGILNAWADLNADGSFSAGEQFVTNNVTNPTLVTTSDTLSFPAPAGGSADPLQTVRAVVGLQIPCDPTLTGQNIAFRFRYTAGIGVGGDAPFGAASNGEVEDYILPVYGWDLGDRPECTDAANPACYDTTVPPSLSGNYKNTGDPATAAGGARHIVIPGSVRLGSSVDTELNATVSAGAGDTNTGGDGSDEDGWTASSGTILTSRWDNGQDGFMRVNVSSVDSVLGACVYGFIDWEADGFGVGVESEAVTHVTADGQVTLVFPASAERDAFFDGTGGNRGVYIRFRVIDGTGNPTDCAAKSSGNYILLPGNASGYACSGEVEDYYIPLTPTAVTLYDFSTTQASTNIIFAVALIALVGATAVALIAYRRKREI